jgi:hypothetical protein
MQNKALEKRQKETQKKAIGQIIGTLSALVMIISLVMIVSYINNIEKLMGFIA